MKYPKLICMCKNKNKNKVMYYIIDDVVSTRCIVLLYDVQYRFGKK